jgi:hypothetical protein
VRERNEGLGVSSWAGRPGSVRKEREGSGRARGPLLAQRGRKREGGGAGSCGLREENEPKAHFLILFSFSFSRISIMSLEMNLISNLVVSF